LDYFTLRRRLGLRRSLLRYFALHSPSAPFTLEGVTTTHSSRRWLYLLALFQLVGGPLVLMQVMVFCKITAREVPVQGVVKAMVTALESPEFQSQLTASNDLRSEQSGTTLPPKKIGADKKIFGTEWRAQPLPVALRSANMTWQPLEDACLSAWPQAPPAPPPRLA